MDLDKLSKDQLIDLIEKNRKEIDSATIEIHRITEQIPDNHRDRFLIANQCMRLQKVCENLGEFYIDFD